MGPMKMKKKNLWILSGSPASGKSTFIKKTFTGDNTKIISRDTIRFSMLNEGNSYFAKEKEVFREFINQIKTALNEVDNVVVDATHINERSRNKLLDAIGEYRLRNVLINCIWMDIPLEVALERNSKREGKAYVPEDAIKRMYANFSKPNYYEKYSYDKIWRVDEEGNSWLEPKEVD